MVYLQIKAYYKDHSFLKFILPNDHTHSVPAQSAGSVEYIYLPTLPLGQDMTQGQFLSGV